MKRFINGPILFALAVLLIVGAVQFLAPARTSETPAIFAEHLSLDEAVERASSSGKVVLAVATADWCGPCQGYKREALASEALAQWVSRHAVPVLIDVDADPDAASRLRVSSIPATFLIDQRGEVVARLAGNAPTARLRSWLETSAPASSGFASAE